MRINVLQQRGLGNQLFQYVAGLFFAKKYSATLEIIREPDDLASSFGHPRPFLLSNFCITESVRELDLRDRLMCSVALLKKPIAAPARFASRTVVYRQPVYEDGTFLPDLPIPGSTRNVYLEGNFQAYKFAEDVDQRVRAEFRFRNPPVDRNLDTLNQIQTAENPVSLHVRRGDYKFNKGGQELLPIEYYARAMQVIREKVTNPAFFVFSDDIPYAREALPHAERMVFVDHNDETNGHEDLRLMSSCRHNIIANSTLSWWGAWLNPAPTRLVCAPKVWRNPKISYADLIPPGWFRIANDGSPH
jgi:Glycosyl transferase family 11